MLYLQLNMEFVRRLTLSTIKTQPFQNKVHHKQLILKHKKYHEKSNHSDSL